MIYNVVLVYSVQQSESVVYTHCLLDSFRIQAIAEYGAELPVLTVGPS